jgi:hypothetical protein
MVRHLLSLASISFLAVLKTVSFAQSVNDPIVLEAPNSIAESDGTTVPLIGFRSASSSLIDGKMINAANNGHLPADAYFVPENTLVKAWLKDEKFAEAAAAALKTSPQDLHAKSTLTIEQLERAGIEVQKFDWTPIESGFKSVKPFPINSLANGQVSSIDSSALIGMTASGAIDVSKTYDIKFNGTDVKIIGFSNKAPGNLFQTYTDVADLQNQSFTNPTTDWNKVQDLINSASIEYPIDIRKSITFQLGSVTFGKPRLKTAKEAKFVLDQNLTRTNDVYLVTFAFTLYNLPNGKIDELSFRIDCGSDCTAWALEPMKVVSESQVSETAKTPSVSIEGFSVGEMFGRTVNYKSLKPQIVAFGVQEGRFSWSIRDAAIETGSHIFAAAIGVPKGTKAIKLSKSLAARMSPNFIFFSEGGWLSTSDIDDSMQLLP